MSSCVVLLSSGLDSTVNLAWAIHKGHQVRTAITFDYGQKAAAAEIRQSKKICDYYEIEHQLIELPWLQRLTRSSLVDLSVAVPVGEQVQIDNLEVSKQTAEAVWVPNRNGVFLNIAASFAESLGAEYVVTGFNKEEAATFPDNTPEFLSALDQSFKYSTQAKVKTLSATTHMTKIEIVKLGQTLSAPFDMMWPCYFSENELCRECESCQRFFRAYETLSDNFKL